MGKKIWSGFVIALNAVGIICLVYYAVTYFMHDTTVLNPNAMIPFQRWEVGGWALTLGLFPLTIANVLAVLFVGKDKIKMPVRLLFLLPCVICFAIVALFWGSAITG
jgi:hypothetical protein